MAGRTDPDRARPEPSRRISDGAPIVTWDGERIELTLRGPRIMRTYLVEGLIGSDDARLYSSLFTRGIPQLGAVHPVIEGAVAGKLSTEYLKNSPSKAKIQVEYGFFVEDDFLNLPNDSDPDSAVLTVSSAVQPVVTNFDAEDSPILIVGAKIFPPEGGPLTIDLPPQRAEVEFQQPMVVVSFKRRENQSPGDKAKAYVGTINDRPVFGDLENFWMCTRIDGTTDDRGETYNVTYEFQRNPDTWDAEVVYRDEKTGLPANTVGETGLLKNVRIYDRTNFVALNLVL